MIERRAAVIIFWWLRGSESWKLMDVKKGRRPWETVRTKKNEIERGGVSEEVSGKGFDIFEF